jgi:hypothetical protein
MSVRFGTIPGASSLGWCALLVITAMTSAATAFAQQKTGPGVPEDDSLTWHGITLYGVVDAGIQYDTHSAPFSSYRPAASGNIVRSNDYGPQTGVTPSNMGQSRVGLQGVQSLICDWSAIFQVESFFNPQSGKLANSMKSVTANNGKAANQQSIGVDGSSAGQAFQTAFVGVQSARLGALTFGRQVTLLSEGMIKFDPNYLATEGRHASGHPTWLGSHILWGSDGGHRHVMLRKMYAETGAVAHAALDCNFGPMADAYRANDR